MKQVWTIVPACILALAVTASAQYVIEGFEDGDISEYVVVGIANPSVTAAAAHDGMYGLDFPGPVGAGWIYRDDAAVHVQQGDRISWWTRTPNGTSTRNYLGFGATAGGCYSVVLGVNTNQLLLQYNNGYGYSNIAAVPHVFAALKWYRVELDWGVGGGMVAYLYDSDGTSLLNSVVAADNVITGGGLAFRSFDLTSGTSGYFDTVTLLNTIAVEPTSWGSIKSLYR